MLVKNLMLILFFFAHFKTEAGTILVGKNKRYTSVQKGIDAAMVGDTVFVYPGIYKEHDITITKKIYVKGLEYQMENILTCPGLIVLKKQH